MDRARKSWKKLPLRFTEQFSTLARSVNRMPDSRDRRERACFAVPTNANSGGIRLNLVGREPNGKLHPGKEADDFVARLIDDLGELTEPSSGRVLVNEVLRSREAFPGENVDLLPDLFVRWNRETLITGVSSPKIGTIIEEDISTRRTGDHRSGGLYFVHGPGLAAGVRLPTARDEDIADRRVRGPVSHVEVSAVMGGCDLDLREAVPAIDPIAIQVFAMWGGIDIRIPPGWVVEIEAWPILGGVVDNTQAPALPAHRVILRGMAFMGGVEIKN